MVNYSFIIPHKNTPDLLQKCLDSIPRRDDVQIIVVDDNSDEDKVDFEHFPGLDDPMVEVYLTKEGRGAGYARNVGLDHAVGKWLVFADADDFFNPCISDALTLYSEVEADVVFFKGNSICIPEGIPSNRANIMNKAIDTALQTNDFSALVLLSSPCRRFIRHDLVKENNIRFSEVRWSNDVVFIAKVMMSTKRYLASEMSIYCITQSARSLTSTTTFECKKVRFLEDCKGTMIYRKRFPSNKLSSWFFYSWMEIYKLNKIYSLSQIPRCIYICGFPFIKEMLKAKFRYNDIQEKA